MNTTNRRQFLAAALAGPAAAAALAAAKSPTPGWQGRPHNPDDAKDDACRCRACAQARAERCHHGLAARAYVTLRGADVALGRLLEEHCEGGRGLKDGCDVCLDADACRNVLDLCRSTIECEIIWPDNWPDACEVEGRARAAAARTGPAGVGALFALHDALDGLLDVVAWHCDDWQCFVCRTADYTVYHVGTALSLIDWGMGKLTLAPVLKRELLTAQRSMARLRRLGGGLGSLMPHTAHAHRGAEEAEHLREMLALAL